MNLDIICIAITRFLKCIKENGRLLGLEGKSERINKRNRNGQRAINNPKRYCIIGVKYRIDPQHQILHRKQAG